MTKQTIEIDCAPGTARPDSYISQVIAGTPLEGHLAEPVSMCFGNWTWAFPDIPPEQWAEAQRTTKERLITLYNVGCIRYASW